MRDNSLTRVLTANRPDVLAPPRGKQVAALRQGTHSPSAYRKIACSLFLFLAVIYGEPAFSCSLAFRLPVEPTPGEHVFIGTVVGYADPIEAPKLKYPAWGIRVQVTDVVHLPPPARQEYEVYFFSTNSMCGHEGLAKDYVQSKYGIGTQVQVVASPWKEPPAKNKRAILAVDPFLDSRYAAKPSKAIVTAESQFDYKQQHTWDFKHWEESVEETVFSFEWRKDLFRLQKTKVARERAIILKRMIAAPYNSDVPFYRYLCPDLVKKHISEQAILKDFLSECHRQDVRYTHINEAKGMEITRLDPQLPGRLLGVWWEDLLGPTVDVTWDIQDCREIGGVKMTEDPVCVETKVKPAQDRSITVLLLIDTNQHLQEPKVLQATVATEKGDILRFNALHEVAEYLFKNGWATSNPCNKLPPTPMDSASSRGC